jgi:hypothetical protein
METNGTRETCDELGIRLIAYSPLALGLLTGKYGVDNPPPGLRGFAYKEVLPPLPSLLAVMKVGVGNTFHNLFCSQNAFQLMPAGMVRV